MIFGVPDKILNSYASAAEGHELDETAENRECAGWTAIVDQNENEILEKLPEWLNFYMPGGPSGGFQTEGIFVASGGGGALSELRRPWGTSNSQKKNKNQTFFRSKIFTLKPNQNFTFGY